MGVQLREVGRRIASRSDSDLPPQNTETLADGKCMNPAQLDDGHWVQISFVRYPRQDERT